MNFIGNILWFIFGGFVDALVWFLVGILWSITIIGIPVGRQCFKMAKLHLWPFGKSVEYSLDTTPFIFNILWLLLGGIPIALAELASGVFLCMTIIGIPFGIQQFKLAVLALMPFGAKIVNSDHEYISIQKV